jgi:hypothetical protein
MSLSISFDKVPILWNVRPRVILQLVIIPSIDALRLGSSVFGNTVWFGRNFFQPFRTPTAPEHASFLEYQAPRGNNALLECRPSLMPRFFIILCFAPYQYFDWTREFYQFCSYRGSPNVFVKPLSPQFALFPSRAMIVKYALA